MRNEKTITGEVVETHTDAVEPMLPKTRELPEEWAGDLGTPIFSAMMAEKFRGHYMVKD